MIRSTVSKSKRDSRVTVGHRESMVHLRVIFRVPWVIRDDVIVRLDHTYAPSERSWESMPEIMLLREVCFEGHVSNHCAVQPIIFTQPRYRRLLLFNLRNRLRNFSLETGRKLDGNARMYGGYTDLLSPLPPDHQQARDKCAPRPRG